MRILILSRNIELYSTTSLVNAAKSQGHFVRVIDHMACDLIIEKEKNEIIYQGYTIDGYDAIIPRIGHTATKYGSSVVRQFESAGVYTTLTSQALINARNKLNSLQILSANGIDIPKTIVGYNHFTAIDLAAEIDKFPKILKLISGTHGLGVVKADNQNVLESVIESFYNLRQKTLIQKFVAEANGEDIRALVVDGKIVASMIRRAGPGEFRSNLHRGGTSNNVLLSDIEIETALKSAKILGLRVAGVDMLRSDTGPLVLEVNASPGLEGIETTTKVNVAKAIIKMIEKNARR